MKLSIRNFQSLGSVDLDVEGLTVLVGRSNTGKSALIRALQGALFNLPGKEFVRTGAKNAVVAIDGLPTTGAPLTVAWTKGAKNAYTVNGASFSNVGTGTPPAIEQGGYHDVWIGDEAKKKGESIRPQVADQFDPLFLLTRSGGFVADVFSTVARIAQLMTAQDRCSTDLRRAKQTAGLARTSLETTRAQLASLDGLDAFEDRVTLLGQKLALLKKEETRLASLRQLAARRAALKTFLTASLTVPDVWDMEAIETANVRRNGLAGARYLLQRLRPLQGLTLPAAAVLPALPTQVPQLRQLAPRLKTLRALVALVLPDTLARDEAFLKGLDPAAKLINDTRTVRATYVRMLPIVRQCEMAASAAAVEVDEASAKLATALAALKICPVCERPTRVESTP